MSTEQNIVDILNGLSPRCPTSNFAAIARIHSRPRVEAGLSGREPFDNQSALRYLDVARKLKSLSESVELPLDWSECLKVRAALDDIDNGSLIITVNRRPEESTNTQEPAFMVYVDLNTGGRYFVRYGRQRPGGQSVLVNSPNTSDAAHLTKACAEQVVAALVKVGYRGRIVPASGASRNGVIDVDLFSDLWN